MSDYDQYFEKFLQFTRPLGLKPTARQLERIQRYLEELIRWNQKINLTGSEDFRDLLLRHVLDSLIPIAAIGKIGSLLDVGTGAGFPGIPLKIFNLEWEITLIDAKRKKASFNQHVIRLLALSGIEVEWTRIEDPEFIKRFENDPFDVIISRAVFDNIDILCQRASLLKQDGRLILMKGRLSSSQREMIRKDAGKYALRLLDIQPYRLPDNKERNLVIMG